MADIGREIQFKSRSASEWEDRFSHWSTPPSETEQSRIERTVREIQEAIRLSPRLSSRQLEIFPQGSYANRVNVRQDSDVDVCCLYSGSVFYELGPGLTFEDTGLTSPVSYTYATFKDDVESALVAHFGRQAVTRGGGKAIDINAPNYLVDADVVACFEFQLHHTRGMPPHVGTALKRDDNGKLVTGFPVQHRIKGQEKNTATSRRYRQQVRIIKTLRNNMQRWGIASADEVSSFGLESLFWNAPNSIYLNPGSHFDRLEMLMMSSMISLGSHAATLKEANGIKTLFGGHTDRTPKHYVDFLNDVTSVLRY